MCGSQGIRTTHNHINMMCTHDMVMSLWSETLWQSCMGVVTSSDACSSLGLSCSDIDNSLACASPAKVTLSKPCKGPWSSGCFAGDVKG